MADSDFRVKNGIIVGANASIAGAITTVDSIQLDLAAGVDPPALGQLAWNADDNTVSVGLGVTSLQLGQEQFYYIKNQSGNTIGKGNTVMFAGTLGSSGRILGTAAVSDGSYPSKYIIGVASHDIDNGEDGYVTSFGKIRQLDTSMFSEGDILFANPATPGTLSNTAPIAPNNKVVVAAVVNSDSTNGELFVRVTFADDITDLEGVYVDNVQSGQTLVWSTANSRFENSAGGSELELYAENPSSPTAPSATGLNAVAIGSNATATQDNNISIGVNSDATGLLSSSFGIAADSAGGYSTALGYASGTSSLAPYSLAAGASAQTAGASATALTNSYASGADSFSAAISTNSSSYGATGTNSVAIGKLSKATGTESTAIGRENIASGDRSFAAGGFSATASHTDSIAIGYQALARNSKAIAIGYSNDSAGIGSLALGYNVTASHDYSIVLGSTGTASSATNEITLGSSSDTVRISSAYTLPTSDGANNQVLTTDGAGGVTFADVPNPLELYAENYDGTSTKPSATATNSIAIGKNSVSGGGSSVAFGSSASSGGNLSSALGFNATVGSSGSYSAAIGQAYANGTDSFAAAMGTNSSSYGATGANSVAIGYLAKASGVFATSIGYGTQATAGNAMSFGRSSLATGSLALALGYQANASAERSVAIGSNAKAEIKGKFAYAAYDFGSSAIYSQTGTYTLLSDTTDATPEALTTNRSTASTDNQIILPNNSAYFFSGTLVAREQASSGTDMGAWEIKGAIRREGSAGTTTLVKSTIDEFSAPAGWSIALTADTTNGGLAITVTGAAATNIRWVATVHTSEVTY